MVKKQIQSSPNPLGQNSPRQAPPSKLRSIVPLLPDNLSTSRILADQRSFLGHSELKEISQLTSSIEEGTDGIDKSLHCSVWLQMNEKEYNVDQLAASRAGDTSALCMANE